MYNILVCDDDKEIVRAIEIYLKGEKYNVFKAYNGQEAIDILAKEEIHLLLIDVMMPVLDGIRATLKIREKSGVPIIILSAKSEDNDKILGLNIGADDYISKPYNAQVLLARIQKLLARTYEIQDNVVLTHKGLTLNLLKAEISYQGQRKSLTKNEMGILRLLMVNKGNIIPRDAIIDELWQSEQFIDENTLNVNIVRLRKTLAEIGLPDYLETKRGLGYCV